MRKVLSRTAAALLLAIFLLGLFLLGFWYLNRDYLFWNGKLLPRTAQTLDIRGTAMKKPEALSQITGLRHLDARQTGMTLEQYHQLTQALPDCIVRWDVPVQGGFYPLDTLTLTVDALDAQDLEALAYLPELEELDVGRWGDYPGILALCRQYPDWELRCQVELSGQWWDNDAVSLVVPDASVSELMERLPCFTRLESVMLTGAIPDFGELEALQAQFPQVFFLWKMEAMGMTLETDMTSLNISHIVLEDTEQLRQLLPWFPKLEVLMLNSQGLPQADLIRLARDYPQIHFVFDLTIGAHTVRTDAMEIDISNTPLESTAQVEELLPCFPDLTKVVMCQCGISDEDMDALNSRHGDIRFVWSVDLGGMQFRTDAVHFTPNRWGLQVDNEDAYRLRYCTDMVCVDIGHQIKVTDCEFVRYMPNLKYLVLAETGISDISPLENHENLIFLELFLSKVKDYSPLVTCRALEDLNLCYTTGDWKPIAEMTWLKRLWWSGSWKARTKLKNKLPDTEAEYLSLSSTGRGWREGQNYYDMRDFIGMEYMTG